jgi:hypothetical protein
MGTSSTSASASASALPTTLAAMASAELDA